MGNYIEEHQEMERGVNIVSKGCGIGAFIIAMIVALLVCLCSGCRTTKIVKETITKTDTVTVKRDSIIIHDRIDTVTITLPQSVQVVEIPIGNDTLSILSDKYYTSTAAVFDGRLRHSLRSNPGATLTGTALVHDTVKVYVDSTMINNSTSHNEIKEVPVNRLYWWQKLLMTLGGIGLLATGFAVTRRLLIKD